MSESESFFNGIKVSQGDGTNLYSVDDDMKLSLIRMGQVNNVVASLGMRERLSQGFVCRARARYETGPRARMALEIPLYFAGAYGLGRLAVRAGVGAISTTARAGMIGLDIVEGARAVEETMNACFPDEFLSGSLDESCTGESEISSVYQEADIAACVTTGVLSVAPVAFVGGVRIWARTSGRTAPRVAPAAQAVPEEAAENVIVVTARRERVTTRARAESENAPQRAPTNLPRSEGELPKVAQNKINLVSERIQRLRFANRDPNAVTGFVKNKKLKRGISEAFTKMNDPAYVSQYMSELQEETFRVMLASGDSKLRSMANWGKIDKETMINVLKSRASRNGVNVVRIEQAEGSLSTQAFNARIGQGYLIDHGFPEGISHGTYTHLLQQDMAYDVISRVSGKPHSEIVEFFGTSDGMRVWDNMFDADPKLLSPHSPEYFQNNIMKNNVPLGYIRRDKTPGSDNRLLLPV